MRKGAVWTRAKVLAFLGVVLAVLLVGAVTFPYVIAWVNLGDESKGFHVVYVDGETYVWRLGEDSYHKSSVFVNVTMVSIHPKAAVEAMSNMFSSELVFFVVLHPNVTEFICDKIQMEFRSLTDTYDYYWGVATLSFTTGSLVEFHRGWLDKGNITPFSTKVSLPINPSHWPPFRQTLTSLLPFADRIETAPLLTLSGRFRTINNTEIVNYGLSVHFNMTSHKTSIHRFNYPPTLWLAYGTSILILIVSLIYLRRKQP
ncbi:MAG: hypothetical protein ACLFU9_02930 [Candidatus Bathyarchaeia archaeon]